ncbi:MAG TPA: M36 family metallopeptidase [Saprospiraceae bacterium]|nr:M36 family metallopeptidase [Saprospiraceae bacterium]
MVNSDIGGLTISKRYTDTQTGITRIYLQQRYNGIPVQNAILNVVINPEGKVIYAGNRFISRLDEKVNATVSKLSPDEAVTALTKHLDIAPVSLQMKRSNDESEFIFDKGNFASEDVKASLCYQPVDGKVHIAWNIQLAPLGTNDLWNTRVDAVNGKILDEDNWTVYCHQGGKADYGEENSCQVHPDHFEIAGEDIQAMSISAKAQYKVWAYPIENPKVGSRSIVVDPADAVASPYGWHDTDGQPGAEYTIPRGNNAHVFLDRDGNGEPNNDEPDGGPDLVFDYPYDPLQEPDVYVDAAQVNIFYWTNFFHDFIYKFGFDEAAGNFQKNNYGRGGVGNDYIRVRSQYGADIDTSNNAWFTYATEGNSPRMSMLLFRGFHNYLTVNEPASIDGLYKTSPPSPGWGAGAYVTTTPVTAEVVVVDDGIENPYENDACESILNAAQLNGKIALVERGGCQFGWKALQVQQAGAIGMICGNYDDDNYTMNPGQYGAQVNIPVVMIGAQDVVTLKQFIETGLQVSLVDPGVGVPQALDSDLDNGLIVHELTHGVSDRLAGGGETFCLNNAENMAEGWSDFFALALTAKAGDSGEQRRGFAYYLEKEESTEKGLRRFPYSTDMNIMPLTYGTISSIQEEHDLGQVWGAVLWDMYWELVNQYGWSADPYDPSSGNYRAIKLVVEGLKNCVCSPGFIDGRDAILAADQSLYAGSDVCKIWEVFARRGIGYSADQGSPEDAGDQKEAFDIPPVCTNQILVKKSVTDFIHAGDEIYVTIDVGNYKTEIANNVKVTDEIPDGTQYKVNSSNFPAVVQGNSISFEVGNMLPKDNQTITYTLLSDPDLPSRRIYLDGITIESSANWLAYTLGDPVANEWHLDSQLGAHTGNLVWNTVEAEERGRQALELNPDHYTFHVDGDHPVLRFYHRMQTAGGISGGVVDIREVGAMQWETVQEDDMLRNGYTTLMDYIAFITPEVMAFSGNSGPEFKASYVDLRAWSGKDIQIRFRFGTIANTHGGEGWLIDDVEFMDLVSYNSEVCVTTEQGDMECALAPESGTIVDSREMVSSVIEQDVELPVTIFPNPASDHITLQWNDKGSMDIKVMLESIDGKLVSAHSLPIDSREQVHINVNDVPEGLYLVKINTDQGQSVFKILIQH